MDQESQVTIGSAHESAFANQPDMIPSKYEEREHDSIIFLLWSFLLQ